MSKPADLSVLGLRLDERSRAIVVASGARTRSTSNCGFVRSSVRCATPARRDSGSRLALGLLSLRAPHAGGCFALSKRPTGFWDREAADAGSIPAASTPLVLERVLELSTRQLQGSLRAVLGSFQRCATSVTVASGASEALERQACPVAVRPRSRNRGRWSAGRLDDPARTDDPGALLLRDRRQRRGRAPRAGINLVKIRTTAFLLCSLTAGIAGVVYASRVRSISTSIDGGTLVLYAVAAAVIGGTSLFGGRGKAIHGVLGGIVIAGIDNGMGLLGFTAACKYMVTALVLLAAVAIDALSRRGRVVAL
jgi:hypothetical protein